MMGHLIHRGMTSFQATELLVRAKLLNVYAKNFVQRARTKTKRGKPRAKHVLATNTALPVQPVVHILKVLVLLEPMLTAVAMRVLPVLLTNTALSAEPSVWPVVLMEPLVTAVHGRVSRLVLLEILLTTMNASIVLLTNSALPVPPVVVQIVLLEPGWHHIKCAKHVLVTNTALSGHRSVVTILQVLVLLEPLLTAMHSC